MLYGFTVFVRSKDYFIVTSQQKKTRQLAKKILPILGFAVQDGNAEALCYLMKKATCEIKTLNNGRQYYEISGENFGGCGGFADEDNTIIIYLD